MSRSQHADIQNIKRKQVLQTDPLADIAIASLNKIIQEETLSREEKLRLIIEFNLSFSIVKYCMMMCRVSGKLQEVDYVFLFLQLANWYKVNPAAA